MTNGGKFQPITMYFLRACNWQFSQYEDKVHLTLLDMLKLLYKYKQTNIKPANSGESGLFLNWLILHGTTTLWIHRLVQKMAESKETERAEKKWLGDI